MSRVHIQLKVSARHKDYYEIVLPKGANPDNRPYWDILGHELTSRKDGAWIFPIGSIKSKILGQYLIDNAIYDIPDGPDGKPLEKPDFVNTDELDFSKWYIQPWAFLLYVLMAIGVQYYDLKYTDIGVIAKVAYYFGMFIAAFLLISLYMVADQLSLYFPSPRGDRKKPVMKPLVILGNLALMGTFLALIGHLAFPALNNLRDPLLCAGEAWQQRAVFTAPFEFRGVLANYCVGSKASGGVDIIYVLAFPVILTVFVFIVALYKSFIYPLFRVGILSLEFIFPLAMLLLMFFPKPLRMLAGLWMGK